MQTDSFDHLPKRREMPPLFIKTKLRPDQFEKLKRCIGEPAMLESINFDQETGEAHLNFVLCGVTPELIACEDCGRVEGGCRACDRDITYPPDRMFSRLALILAAIGAVVLTVIFSGVNR